LNSFDEIFKAVKKKADKDPLSSAHKSGDLTISSYIPFSILTGVPELDYNIARPGWPAGRVVELFGYEHCGKTTLAYHAIAEAQRMGGGGYFIDTEKSWDERRAIQCGVDPDLRFGIMDCDSIEAAFRSILNILDARIDNNDGKPFIIVVDSVTGTATEFMKKHEMGKEERIGQDARAIRGGMRRIMPKLAKSKVNLFMINHAIATCATFKFAKQSEAAGGHAIKLLSAVRVNLAHSGWITVGEKENTRRIGQKIKMRVEKLKGSCMSEPEIKDVALYNTHGFDTLGSLLTAGCTTGWVTHKKGSADYYINSNVDDEEINFGKAGWEQVVNDRGGLHTAYQEFIQYCMEQGIMETWGG
jgi:recombination protein RecA